MRAVMNVSEETLSYWSTGPSESESEKCENAERMIKKAIDACDKLAALNISVFAQGSPNH